MMKAVGVEAANASENAAIKAKNLEYVKFGQIIIGYCLKLEEIYNDNVIY